MKVQTKRVFIKDLPETATQAEIESYFAPYGTVASVEIKERKELNAKNQSLFFAYVNLQTDDQSLQKCFADFADTPWHGQYVKLQLAKESFLERLKREREENGGAATEVPKQTITPLSEKRGTDVVKETRTTVPAQNGRTAIKNKIVYNSSDSDESSSSSGDDVKMAEPCEKLDIVIKNNKGKTLNGVGLKIESVGNKPIVTVESRKRKRKDPAELTQSESQRLKALDETKRRHRDQKSAVQAALARVDARPNNKIVFDDAEPIDAPTRTSAARLFGDSDESDGGGFENDFEVKTQFEGNKGQKLLALQSRYKHDGRFALSEKFADEDVEGEPEEVEDEKSRQMKILGEVLGKEVKPIRGGRDSGKPQGMVRYDPTLSEHSRYEVKNPEAGPKVKKKRKAKEMAEETGQVEESAQVEEPVVSKKVFYKVSAEALKDALQEKQPFSLLSMFGRAEEKPMDEPEEVAEEIKRAPLGHERNPFRYESSDDEDDVQLPQEAEKESQEGPKDKLGDEGSSRLWSEPFFFKDDDYRLQEGLDFINRMASSQNQSEFGKVRRNLKEIVRAKVRNSQRKDRPFKRKLGGNKRKKMIRMKKAMKR